MGILSIILGIILIIGGVCCMFTPFANFLASGYIIAMMAFVYGIFGFKEQNIRSKIIPLLMVLAALVCLCI